MTAAGDIKPAKNRSTERIDLVVALLMGVSRWIANPVPPSVYRERGLLAFDLA
jgi:hypothetical protein